MVRFWTRPVQLSSPPGEVSRLLLIRPGGIGDAVLLVPAIRVLRQAWPDATLHVLAEGRNAAIFGLCPEVDATFHYDRPKELATVLRGSYDVVIDTEQWHRLSAILGRLVRPGQLIGFASNDRSRVLTAPVAYCQDDYEAQSFLHLLGPLGMGAEGGTSSPFLVIPKAVRDTAATLLGEGGTPRVVLFPGASIAERRWGAGRFAEVARRLAEAGTELVVVGGAEDRAAAEEIVAKGRGLNLAGRTSLIETAAVLAQSHLLISGDSGVLHLGVGLGVPTVSLFGPGRARKWAPRGDCHIVLNKELVCSPCTTFGYTPPCPIHARCLQEITVDEVFAAASNLLDRCSERK